MTMPSLLTVLYTIVYTAAVVVIYLDLFVWRP
jgi:hypothetical protein